MRCAPRARGEPLVDVAMPSTLSSGPDFLRLAAARVRAAPAEVSANAFST